MKKVLNIPAIYRVTVDDIIVDHWKLLKLFVFVFKAIMVYFT